MCSASLGLLITLQPHLKLFILLQQVSGLLGSAGIGVLDVLHQPAVGLFQAGTALLQLLYGIYLLLGQILQELWIKGLQIPSVPPASRFLIIIRHSQDVPVPW